MTGLRHKKNTRVAQLSDEKVAAERAAARQLRAAQQWERVCDGDSIYCEATESKLPFERVCPGTFERVLAWQHGPTGLLLVGPTDRGKTFVLHILLKRLNEQGLTIEMMHGVTFGHRCGQLFRDGRGVDWIARLARADILAVDDLAKVSWTERVQAEMSWLVEARVSHRRPILVTMNGTAAELRSQLTNDRADALIRRLVNFCDVIQL